VEDRSSTLTTCLASWDRKGPQASQGSRDSLVYPASTVRTAKTGRTARMAEMEQTALWAPLVQLALLALLVLRVNKVPWVRKVNKGLEESLDHLVHHAPRDTLLKR
jgi:hypothetical protein